MPANRPAGGGELACQSGRWPRGQVDASESLARWKLLLGRPRYPPVRAARRDHRVRRGADQPLDQGRSDRARHEAPRKPRRWRGAARSHWPDHPLQPCRRAHARPHTRGDLWRHRRRPYLGVDRQHRPAVDRRRGAFIANPGDRARVERRVDGRAAVIRQPALVVRQHPAVAAGGWPQLGHGELHRCDGPARTGSGAARPMAADAADADRHPHRHLGMEHPDRWLDHRRSLGGDHRSPGRRTAAGDRGHLVRTRPSG